MTRLALVVTALLGLSDATDRRDVIAWLKVETGYVPATQ